MLSHQGDRAGRRRDLIDVEREPDGTLRLRGEPLREHAATLTELLDDAARRAPDRPFLVEAGPRGAWRQVTFRTVAERSWRIAAALRELGATPDKPVMILSGNGIEHALMTFGALRAGVPVVAVDAAAGLDAQRGFGRLRALADVVRPAVVFARDGAAYGAAVRALALQAAFVCVTEPAAGMPSVDFSRLLAHAPPPADAVAIGPDTVAKIVFGRRRTGEAKGVVTTHGMVCSMLQGMSQAWPFLAEEPPVVVDALPWSGAFGGNAVLGIVLRHAGTLYVDRPVAAADQVEHLSGFRSVISPTLAFDVPSGWTAWAQHVRADDGLRRRWLSGVRMACWTGATLQAAARDALDSLGVPLASAWGSTEAGSVATLTTDTEVPGEALGAPVAGVELKLIPHEDAYEARVRGAQVTSGYWWRPDLSAAAFDGEGFYRTGDIVRPIHARAPERGIALVSRLDGSFTLSSGVSVDGRALRARFLAECSDAADALVTGSGRDDVGLLVWPSADAMLLGSDLLRAQIAAAMRRLAATARPGDAPRRALIVEDARISGPAHAPALIARLHASEPDVEVIRV
ncbi:MAG TPA: AMP-binding protein [Candidatus Elarobacter sp.]